MAERLQLNIASTDEASVIGLNGELDLTTIHLLSEAVNGHFADGHDVELDCEGLRFIDSTGLSALVDMLNQAVEANVRFTLINVPNHALRLMQITKIDSVLGL